MSYLVVANAHAGSAGGLEEAARILDRAGGCEVVWTEQPGDIDRALRSDPASTPVIAGGDGSVHLVVNRLVRLDRLDRPVGILPMGTGNDLARGLGLPLPTAEAAHRITAGVPLSLPLMVAPDGEVGVNNAHTGLGVAAARRGAEWKQRLGSMAYTVGSVAEGLGYSGLTVELAVDGEAVHQGPCLALMMLVGPSAGGGFHPLADVGAAEAILDVLVIGAGESPGRAGLVMAALRGQLDEDDEVLRRRGRAVDVRVEGEEWELDGEFRTWPDRVSVSLDERSWSVLT